MRVLGVCWGISRLHFQVGCRTSLFLLLIIIVANHHLKPNHRSIRKPNNPNEQATFHIADKSFHIGDTHRSTVDGYPRVLAAARGVHRCRALQDEFAVVVAWPFGLPQVIGFSVGVFSKVNASISVRACGMDGTDEVWVAGDRGDSDGSGPD